MTNFIERLRVQLKKNHLLVYGLPFMTVVLLGPFLLRQFNSVRYKYRKVTQASEEDMKEFSKMMKKPEKEITLEKEYEKLKEMDIDTWEQKRGPRPWEEVFEQPESEKTN